MICFGIELKVNVYFVQSEESQFLDDGNSTEFGGICDLTGHLQSNFDNFQRIGEHHLNGNTVLISHVSAATLKINYLRTTSATTSNHFRVERNLTSRFVR